MPRRKKASHGWVSEKEMLAQLVQYLRLGGWTVYQEIAEVDIVAEKGDIRWCIEGKLTMNLKVLQQANRSIKRKYGNRVSVAIPRVYAGAEQRFGEYVAKRLGIGVLGVGHPSKHKTGLIRTIVSAEELPPHSKALDAHLVPEAEDYAKAGQAGGKRWTPFKATAKRLVEHVHAAPEPPTVYDAIKAVEHHYSSDASARSALSKLISSGAIDGLRLAYDPSVKKHRIHPAEAD